MKPSAIVWLSICTAFSLICMWGTLQVIAPLINETAAVLAQIPNLFSILFVGVAVTYIVKGLFD